MNLVLSERLAASVVIYDNLRASIEKSWQLTNLPNGFEI